jgi:hypothetical protein
MKRWVLPKPKGRPVVQIDHRSQPYIDTENDPAFGNFNLPLEPDAKAWGQPRKPKVRRIKKKS